MTQTKVTGNIHNSFMVLKYISKEVALEQMSKVGSDVQKSMRRAFISNQTPTEVIVYGGRARLFRTDFNPLGIRVSHTTGGAANGAANMFNFINSFLMEKHGTLVVGGAMPSNVPKRRVNGKVVGVMGRVGGVSKQAVAILHRMDTGEENADYPQRSKLMDDIVPRNFMRKGIGAVQGIIKQRLTQGYMTVMEKAEKIHQPKDTEKILA